MLNPGPVQVWHMSLDNTRNRTLQLNLMISIASFAAVMSTVPASFFGMNLHSGIEEAPDLLWWVAGGCLALSSATFTAILLSHRLPRKDEQRKAYLLSTFPPRVPLRLTAAPQSA